MREALVEAQHEIDRAWKRRSDVAKRILDMVVASAKPDVFIAGADLKFFAGVPAPNSPAVAQLVKLGNSTLGMFETLPFPCCAAINGATLGGTGTLGGATTVNSGGVIRGDVGAGTGTLNTRNVTVAAGGNVDMNLGAMDLDTRIGTNNKLNVGTGTFNLTSGAVVRLTGVSGFGSETHGTFILATLTNGSNILLDGGAVSDGQILGEYTVGAGSPNAGPIALDVSGLPTLLNDSKLTLRRSGNNVVLNFTPVPEPAFLLAVCGLAVGGVVGLRKLRRKKDQPADVTPAA